MDPYPTILGVPRGVTLSALALLSSFLIFAAFFGTDLTGESKSIFKLRGGPTTPVDFAFGGGPMMARLACSHHLQDICRINRTQVKIEKPYPFMRGIYQHRMIYDKRAHAYNGSVATLYRRIYAL